MLQCERNWRCRMETKTYDNVMTPLTERADRAFPMILEFKILERSEAEQKLWYNVSNNDHGGDAEHEYTLEKYLYNLKSCCDSLSHSFWEEFQKDYVTNEVLEFEIIFKFFHKISNGIIEWFKLNQQTIDTNSNQICFLSLKEQQLLKYLSLMLQYWGIYVYCHPSIKAIFTKSYQSHGFPTIRSVESPFCRDSLVNPSILMESVQIILKLSECEDAQPFLLASSFTLFCGIIQLCVFDAIPKELRQKHIKNIEFLRDCPLFPDYVKSLFQIQGLITEQSLATYSHDRSFLLHLSSFCRVCITNVITSPHGLSRVLSELLDDEIVNVSFDAQFSEVYASLPKYQKNQGNCIHLLLTQIVDLLLLDQVKQRFRVVASKCFHTLFCGQFYKDVEDLLIKSYFKPFSILASSGESDVTEISESEFENSISLLHKLLIEYSEPGCSLIEFCRDRIILILIEIYHRVRNTIYNVRRRLEEICCILIETMDDVEIKDLIFEWIGIAENSNNNRNGILFHYQENWIINGGDFGGIIALYKPQKSLASFFLLDQNVVDERGCSFFNLVKNHTRPEICWNIPFTLLDYSFPTMLSDMIQLDCNHKHKALSQALSSVQFAASFLNNFSLEINSDNCRLGMSIISHFFTGFAKHCASISLLPKSFMDFCSEFIFSLLNISSSVISSVRNSNDAGKSSQVAVFEAVNQEIQECLDVLIQFCDKLREQPTSTWKSPQLDLIRSELICLKIHNEIESKFLPNLKSSTLSQSVNCQFKNAWNLLSEKQIPLRTCGVVELRRLLLSQDRETHDHKKDILKILTSMLKESDSYLYLAVINTLATLSDSFTFAVLKTLCDEYLKPETEESLSESCSATGDDHFLVPDSDRFNFKLKIGEVLLYSVRRCGETVHQYGGFLINTFLVMSKHHQSYLRASSLSNLAELCPLMGYSLKENINEICVCLCNIAISDTEPLVRRAAVSVIHKIFMCENIDFSIVVEDVLLDFYRTLKMVIREDEDEITQIYADSALTRIDNITRSRFLSL